MTPGPSDPPRDEATAGARQRGVSVLLCYDGSDDAQHAISSAAALLGPSSAVVFHARGRHSSAPLAQSGADLARRHQFGPVSTAEVDGEPSGAAILATAHEHRVALIVVGSQGMTGLPSSPLGSVSSSLLGRTDLPVLVVRSPNDPETFDVSGPIFVCYDGSAESHGAIEAAADLLVRGEAIVASFLEPVDDIALRQRSLPWPAPATMERRLARLDLGEAELLTQRPSEGVALAASRGLAARPLVVEAAGEAWSELLDLATDAAACCIAMGHHPTTKRLDSTAFRVVCHTDRPVLVVPR
ncbi:MAG TPA: universal stress protein [Solirubrobacteraceae bacterium]|nr:universal stress protein [Solirubrobacteraceae bacterium]